MFQTCLFLKYINYRFSIFTLATTESFQNTASCETALSMSSSPSFSLVVQTQSVQYSEHVNFGKYRVVSTGRRLQRLSSAAVAVCREHSQHTAFLKASHCYPYCRAPSSETREGNKEIRGWTIKPSGSCGSASAECSHWISSSLETRTSRNSPPISLLLCSVFFHLGFTAKCNCR